MNNKSQALPQVATSTLKQPVVQIADKNAGSEPKLFPQITRMRTTARPTLRESEKESSSRQERKSPMDFFKLAENNHVQNQMNDKPLHAYYKTYFQNKTWLQKVDDASTLMTKYEESRSDSKLETPQLLSRKDETASSVFAEEDGVKRIVNALKSKKKLSQRSSDKYEAKQQILQKSELNFHQELVNKFKNGLANDFLRATSVQRSAAQNQQQQPTVYSTFTSTQEIIELAHLISQRRWKSRQPSRGRGRAITVQPSFNQNTYHNLVHKGKAGADTDRPHQIGGVTIMADNQRDSLISDSRESKASRASFIYLPESRRTMKYDNRPKKERKEKPIKLETLFQDRLKRKMSLMHNAITAPESNLSLDELIEQGILTQRQKWMESEATKSNKKRTPKIKTPVEATKVEKRRISFSLSMNKYQDALDLWDPLKEREELTLKDISTIKRMKQARRYPVPGKLLHKKKDYQMRIDTLMHIGYNTDSDNEELQKIANTLELTAPANSQESIEEIHYQYSSEDEAEPIKITEADFTNESATAMVPVESLNLTEDTKEVQQKVQRLHSVKVHIKAMNLNGFNIEILKTYPYKVEQDKLPFYVLQTQEEGKSKMESIEILRGKISYEFKERALFPTMDHVMVVYEHYSSEFGCKSLNLTDYFSNGVLCLKEVVLTERQVKAMVCILPILYNLTEIQLDKNQLSDEYMTLFIMAAFMAPNLNQLHLGQNSIKSITSLVLVHCIKSWPKQLRSLGMQKALITPEHSDFIIPSLHNTKCMKQMNLTGVKLSYQAIRTIGKLIQHQTKMVDLNLSGCGLNRKTLRHLFDCLYQNKGLHSLNISQNRLSSEVFEFTIKIVKLLLIHEQLQHINIVGTYQTKYETSFLCSQLQFCKAIVGIHMSMTNLDFKERSYLRIFMNSHLQQQMQNGDAISKQLEMEEYHTLNEDASKFFIRIFNSYQRQTSELTDNLCRMLESNQIEEVFSDVVKGRFEMSNGDKPKSVLQQMIEGIRRLDMVLGKQRNEIEKFHDQQIDIRDQGFIGNFIKMGLADAQMLSEDENAEQTGQWLAQNRCKIEGVQRRVDEELKRQLRYKPIADMALMFIGISKVAHDVLVNNEHVAMEEVILTRTPNQPLVDSSGAWDDSKACWLCSKHRHQRIDFNESHLSILKQNIKKLDKLDEVVAKCNQPNFEENLELMPTEDVGEFFNIGKQKKKKQQPFQKKLEGFQEDQIAQHETEEFLETSITHSEEYDIANDIQNINIDLYNPLRLNRVMLEKQLPSNFRLVKKMIGGTAKPKNQFSGNQIAQMKIDSDDEVLSNDELFPKTESSAQLSKVKISPPQSSFVSPKSHNNNAIAYQQHVNVNSLSELKTETFITSNESSLNFNKQKTPQQSAQGKKFIKRKKQILFEGVMHEVTEEISVHSSQEPEVRSSEDEFSTNGGEEVIKQFHRRVTQRENEKGTPLRDKAVSQTITRNAFGRKQVYICMSFNDFVPIEMKSQFEIELEIEKGADLFEYLKFSGDRSRSRKKDLNVIQFSSMIPPGKHYFYFVLDRRNIFLSSDYQIVRFKQTNVFLNMIEVSPHSIIEESIKNETNFDDLESEETEEEDEDQQQQRFELKMKYNLENTKLYRICKFNKDITKIKKILTSNYPDLYTIFTKYSYKHDIEFIKKGRFINILTKCNLLDENLSSHTIERHLQSTTTNDKITMSQFNELILKTAQSKYVDNPACKKAPLLSEALIELIEEMRKFFFSPRINIIEEQLETFQTDPKEPETPGL